MVPTKKIFEDQAYIGRITKLLSNLEIVPKKIDNYLLAFVHRSLINERPDLSLEHNERLEFLGDAVLELVITHKLFLDYPKEPEGVLTDYRSSIVKKNHLASVARKLSFPDYLILGKGEELGGGRNNEGLLANSLEAFIGAIYLDLGYYESEKFILKHIYSDLKDIINSFPLKNYKSLLQEYTQKVFGITPEYRVISESGLDHNKNYLSGVFLGDKMIGLGSGSSKKKSQEEAASNAFLNRENIRL